MTKHKHLSLAFKLETAKLMMEEKYSIKRACEAAGAGETAVKRWKAQHLAEKASTAHPDKSAMVEEHREI